MEEKKIILVVEDEPSLVKAMSDKFDKEGFSVLLAHDGKKGLELALEHHPDILLLDIMMPKMGGIPMLEELRKDDWGKGVPVIVLTNLADTQTVSDVAERGVHDYLVKSDWKLEDIVEKVKEKLGM
ncbi:response regulator [Candidatus Parcubacteria bacterium]|nr:MAG: response regulator [Candidatus Parcubacteria bacterium]